MLTRTLKLFILSLVMLLLVSACQQTSPATEAQPEPALQEKSPSTETVQEADPSQADEPAQPVSDQTYRGEFVLDIVSDETEARYIVEEEFFGRGFATAIGITSAIEGELHLVIDPAPAVSDGEFRVDLRTLTSDESRRDNAIRGRWLESNQFPFAVFTPTAVEDFPADFGFNEAEEVRFKLVGDMTIRDVTQPVTFDVVAVGNGDTLQGLATTQFLMTDFGFEPPSIINVLVAENEVKVELEFTLRNRS